MKPFADKLAAFGTTGFPCITRALMWRSVRVLEQLVEPEVR